MIYKMFIIILPDSEFNAEDINVIFKLNNANYQIIRNE